MPAATNTPPATPTSTPTPAPLLYFVVQNDTTLGGLTVANEDVVVWDSAGGFSLLFDGSDVGLDALQVDAFARVGVNQLLLSFTAPATIPGISGTVDDSDVVRFAALSFGDNTAGAFSLYFDASDAGLSTSSEDVDALELLPNGHLVVSTTGSFTVPGVSGVDADLIEFTPASLGANTTGTWALYFDASDVGLSTTSEDLDGFALSPGGDLYLSTTGAFSVPGLAGANEDVFVFTPASLGANTAGSYGPTPYFDGSLYGLGANDVADFELP